MNTYTIGIIDGCDCSSTSTVDLSKYDKHIQDTTVHITQKERDAWNSASAAISGVNIISALSNKADKEDVPTKVSQLQNDMGYLNEVPEEYLTELELKNKGFIRISDLDGLLEGKIPTLSGYATTSWVLQQGFLTEHQHIKQISDGTNTYSLIGDGVVTIKGSTSSDPGTSMVTATDDRIGGIKLGYSENGKNYAVKLDSQDKAYVSVPWVSGGGSSSTGNNSGYYEIIFKAVEKGVNTDVAPKLPTDFDINTEGWDHYAQNSDGSKTVWMASRWVDSNGNKGEWQGPWIISGKDGEAGVDGAYYEYVYTRTTDSDATKILNVNSGEASSASKGRIASDDDFVPQGWYDNPKGVDSLYKFEWMALRHKTFDSNNVGAWSPFIGPILWSNFGVNGNDGDGVEYIYYATTAYNTAAPSGPILNPSNWYIDAWSKADESQTSYNKREYILPDAATKWFDNPINLTTPGQIEYVSIRKRYADKEGEVAYWHKYSQPAFWTSYAKNGTDATGLTLSYTDDNITVDITEEGHPSTPINTTTVLKGNYGNEDVTFTSLPTITAMHTDGSTTGFTFSSTTSSSVIKYNDVVILTCTLSNSDQNIDCNVNIAQYFAIDLKSPVIFTLSVKGTSTSTKNAVSGSKSFRITGIQFGKDGVSYNLVCGVASISKKYDTGRSQWYYSTQSITPKIIETSVNGVADVTSQDGFVIKYSIDGGEEQQLSDTNPIGSVVIGKITQFIIINAYYNDEQFDSQTIYLVEDGAPGTGGNSPTYYQVVDTSSTLENAYQGDTLKLNGTVTFQVYSVKDGVVNNITDQNTLSITPQPGNISIVNNTFAASYTNADATNSVQIQYLYSGTVFASASVPVPTRGKDGSSSSGTQTLTKSSLRYKGEFSTTGIYRDGVTTSESNVYYQDYVTYKNVYYLCVKDVSGSLESPNPYSPNTDDTHWKPLSATNDMFVNLLVANKANIGSLSSNEIVVYDTAPGGANRTIQAGITAGYKFADSPIKDVNNNDGVRIWAGSFTNGNLATAPFTVDSAGHLKATDAQISGEIDAVSGTIGGWDITQNSIRKIYKDDDSNKPANIYLQNSTNKIVQIGGIPNSMMSVRNDGSIGIDISSFGIGGIGLYVLGNANAYGIISFGHTNFISRQGERTYINQLALQNLVLTGDSVTASNVGPNISSPTPIDQQVVPYRIFAIENKDQTIYLGNEFCEDKQIEIILGSRNDGSPCTKTISATWLRNITWIGSHLRAVKMSGETIQFLVGHINDNNIAMYKITIIKSTEYIAIVNRL